LQNDSFLQVLTTSETQIVLKELHEGVIRRHFVVDITAKKILDA
jgi:hypothetical protein